MSNIFRNKGISSYLSRKKGVIVQLLGEKIVHIWIKAPNLVYG
jgi:hypothetical protein